MKKYVGNLWFPHKLEIHIMFEILVMVKTSNVVEAKAEIVMEIMTRAEVSLGRDLWNAILPQEGSY